MPVEQPSEHVIDIHELDADLVAELPHTVFGLAVQRVCAERNEPRNDRYVLWNRFAQ